MRKQDLTGHQYGQLVVIAQARYRAWDPGRPRWRCRCACGNEVEVQSKSLRSGNTKSCGCVRRETCRKRLTTHGLSHTPEHRVWQHMVDRCENPKNTDYKHYGARSIRVCERWRRDFPAFYADMGPRPSPKHSIDRRDNDGPYAPENCVWTVIQKQANNRRNNHRVTWNGRTQTIAQWSREIGLPRTVIFQRLRAHWPMDRVFTQPLKLKPPGRS